MECDAKLSQLMVLKPNIARKLSLLTDYLDKLNTLDPIVAIEGNRKYSIKQLTSDLEALNKDLWSSVLLHTTWNEKYQEELATEFETESTSGNTAAGQIKPPEVKGTTNDFKPDIIVGEV